MIVQINDKKNSFSSALITAAIILLISGCANIPDSMTTSDDTVVVDSSEAHNLERMLHNALPGTTFLLKDGNYPIDGHLQIRAERITLRSYSGNREAVILDGRYRGYILQIAAPQAMIADLTIKRARYHLIHVVGNGHLINIKNLHLVDARQQFIKANPSNGKFCDFGKVQNCYFEMTDEGREKVDPQIGGCYTGGIDVLAARGWIVSENWFENIYCTSGGLPTHMILFWHSSRDPIVERNTIINCARGIGFGLGKKSDKRTYEDIEIFKNGMIGHYGGVIRQNIIFGDIGKLFDTGIGIEQAINVTVENNFVYSTGGTYTSIDSRFPASKPVIKNNTIRPAMTVRGGAKPSFDNNRILP